jgi:hypothetical protein
MSGLSINKPVSSDVKTSDAETNTEQEFAEISVDIDELREAWRQETAVRLQNLPKKQQQRELEAMGFLNPTKPRVKAPANKYRFKPIL